MRISAIILAKNEELRIENCLKSVSWTDEQIVIDNGSTDKTVAIAKKKGARVIVEKSKSFAHLRNRGSIEAKSDWIVYIDADEVISDKLIKQIESTIQKESSADAYRFHRKNFYLGKKWPFEETILRLFKKSALRHWYGELHESPEVAGETGVLEGALLHYTHRTLDEMVAKTNEWSLVEAKLRFDSQHPQIVSWRFFRVMVTAFYDSFIKQSGWRAGVVGIIESTYQAFSIFITYSKLWELQHEKEQHSQ